jgi:hypothetical protein
MREPAAGPSKVAAHSKRPKARTGHEVDVAVVGIADGGKPPLLAIGEAKWNDTMGIAHIERLQHIRDLITQAGRYDTTHAQLICFSGQPRRQCHDPDLKELESVKYAHR